MNKIKVIKLEYETKDKMSWKAIVLAYNVDEAVKSVMNNVPNWDRLTSTGVYGDVDLVSKNVYNDYLYNVDNNTSNDNNDVCIMTKDTEKDQTSSPDSNNVCPVCNRPYKSVRTLVSHIKKYH